MSGQRNTPTFEEFIKEHGITTCAGFWWCEKGPVDPWENREYRGVLLARLEDAQQKSRRRWPRSSVIELHAPTPRGLAKRVRELGFEPPRGLGRLCESARNSPRPPKKTPNNRRLSQREDS